MNVMLDVPFNHTAFDCEMGDNGQRLRAAAVWNRSDIRHHPVLENRGPRLFALERRFRPTKPIPIISSISTTANAAFNAGSIALAADRFDFGKFVDVHDVYFGILCRPGRSRYLRGREYLYERGGLVRLQHRTAGGTTFPITTPAQNSGNGHFDSVTQNVWKYFADIFRYWLQQTGPRRTAAAT